MFSDLVLQTYDAWQAQEHNVFGESSRILCTVSYSALGISTCSLHEPASLLKNLSNKLTVERRGVSLKLRQRFHLVARVYKRLSNFS